MNLNNIEKNMVIKNYKELCKLLEIPIKTGGAKQNQLEWIEEYIDYKKEGHKFIIEYVDYEKDIVPMEDNRFKVDYIDIIEKLILDLLAQGDNKGKVFLSKNKLLKSLEMINNNYAYCKQRMPKLSKFMNINTLNIREWYDTTGGLLERNLHKALKNLENQSLIFWNREITLCEIEPIEGDILIDKIISTDKYGEEIVEYKINDRVKKHYREATEYEKKFIIRTERDVIKELGCNNKQEIIKKNLWLDFDNKVKDILLDKLNVAFYYKSYKIICNIDHILERQEELNSLILESTEKEKHREKLNSSIIERVRQNALGRSESAGEKIEDYIGTPYGEKLLRRLDSKYIKEMEGLNDTLLKRNSEDIRNKIKKIKY